MTIRKTSQHPILILVVSVLALAIILACYDFNHYVSATATIASVSGWEAVDHTAPIRGHGQMVFRYHLVVSFKVDGMAQSVETILDTTSVVPAVGSKVRIRYRKGDPEHCVVCELL